jgi:hypothetical protein
MGYMTGFADNFIRFFSTEFASSLNNLRGDSVALDFNWMITPSYSPRSADVAPFTEGGILVSCTEKKLHQGFLTIFNGVGRVACGALHSPVIVKGEVFRDVHPVCGNITYPMSRVIADLVTGIPHRTIMTGKAHLPCADYPFFLERGERSSLAMQKKDGNPPVMADRALLGRIGTFG